MRYHPPVYGLSGKMELDANELQELITAQTMSPKYSTYLLGHLTDALQSSRKENIPLYRYLFIIDQKTGRLERWVD